MIGNTQRKIRSVRENRSGRLEPVNTTLRHFNVFFLKAAVVAAFSD